jgi:hypothetical protein
MTHTTRTIRTLVTAFVLAFPAVTEAGPPLICHPFQTGSAPVLPWGDGSSWNTPDHRYDVQRLTGDTLRLLTTSAPVLARMENLRRATIYASKDARVAGELLSAVLARALSSAATASPDANALFDAGYLLESYKQAAVIQGGSDNILSGEGARWTIRNNLGTDGYTVVTRAIALAGGSAEMEFAASLMKGGAVADEHRRRASAGATAGSLLARNLATAPR